MESHILASQLRCPAGAEATTVAQKMNETNGSLNRKCIELLRPTAFDSVLEIGPGNAAFAGEIISRADNILYTGLDWSLEMVAEAAQLNQHLVTQGSAQFHHGSSDRIVFDAGVFDKVLTVHTLYFWEQPADHLAEIRRVMKPKGLFCLAFGDRSFMKDLPFTPYGFRLYDATDACALLQSAGFDILDVYQHLESGLSNAGDPVEKLVNIIVCQALPKTPQS
ncbi:MAG: class I SAM-dependent methyltransferase [Pseudohongiella sp.]|uniref:class I SAM-dependent methyltransferase n=1 Tax=Pseudohongiella sp. TaxID=1979412 RepID=UPI00349FD7A9